ncbi:MAG: M67 family metallopeptidase [Saprospiraceae bacterium]|nr:M67 family metallopeptidase [Saprospiraceae bacterium]
MKIIMPQHLVKAMSAWLEEAYPHEACGFLTGRLEGATRIVEQIIPVANRSTENLRRRFVIDPLDYLRAEQQADAAGRVLLGVFHSHPDHPAVPSEHDLASAQPFFSYVIASIENGSMSAIRSYQLQHEAFTEEQFVHHKEETISL